MLNAAVSARLPAHPIVAPAWATLRLIALAFAGQTRAVDRLLAGPLHELPGATQQHWRDTAELAAGMTQAGDDRLRAAAADPATTVGMRGQISYRLAYPPVVASAILADADCALVQHLFDEIDHEERFLPTGRLLMGQPWATYALIAANVAMFVIEMQQGGATSDATLYKLGVVVPQAAPHHEYYRWFMANFLHFGTAHIVMNMLGLLVPGPFVEFLLGRLTYVAVCLLAGLATMASVGALMAYRGEPDDILIGASGAIMALIGATAAVLLRG